MTAAVVTDKNTPIEDEIRKGKTAMRELVKRAMKARKEGRPLKDNIVENDMDLPGIGQIDFRWGHFRKATAEGQGIKKIVGAMKLKREYHLDFTFTPRMIYRVPEVLARGKPVKTEDGRMTVMHDCFQVVLENEVSGTPTPRWVFNAYPVFPEGDIRNMPVRDVARELKKRKKAKKAGG